MMIVNNKNKDKTIQSTIPVAKSTVYTLPSRELTPQISLNGKNIKLWYTALITSAPPKNYKSRLYMTEHKLLKTELVWVARTPSL